MRLTELVELLVDQGEKLRDPNPVVLVRWYLESGELVEREVEMVYAGTAGEVVLHCPLPPVFPGEPGAGDVIDESEDVVDVDLLLEVALGNDGCSCKPGVCMASGDVRYRGCRAKLAAELEARRARARDER